VSASARQCDNGRRVAGAPSCLRPDISISHRPAVFASSPRAAQFADLHEQVSGIFIGADRARLTQVLAAVSTTNHARRARGSG
jgi:hypothetical protein